MPCRGTCHLVHGLIERQQVLLTDIMADDLRNLKTGCGIPRLVMP
jgi:hypothetical protein